MVISGTLRRRAIGWVAVATMVTGLVALDMGATPTTASAATAGGLGTIVSDGPTVNESTPSPLGTWDIFALVDGTMTRITHNTADADGFTPSSSSPSLSPDGTSLVYQRCELGTVSGGMSVAPSAVGGGFEFCAPHIMNVDGTGDRALVAPEANTYPDHLADYDWGPGAIAFTNQGVLYSLDPTSGGATVISDSTDHYWYAPSWSEDGTQLVVEGTDRDEFGGSTGRADIWKIDADGSNPTRLTNTSTAYETFPKWSPDGADIMYEVSDPTNDIFCVQLMPQDGSSHQCVETLDNFSEKTTAAWSKDSVYLGMRFQDPNDDFSDWFGFTPRDLSSADLTEAVKLPAGVETVDWYGDADMPPVADDQELTVPGNGSAALELTASDPDNDPITFEVLTQPQHGTLTGTAPNLVYNANDGYEGDDSFTFQATANGVKSNVATVSITVTKPCTITGDNGHDRLQGTPGPDVLCGLGGNDYIFGNGGDDILYGGGGDDDLIGGPGNDVLDGGKDDDAVRGDEGNDQLIGGEGKDLVSYLSAKHGATINIATQTGHAQGAGNDTLSTVESAFGTGYADTLTGDGGDNQLLGGSGNDVLTGRGGADVLVGKNGKDQLSGGPGGDGLFGGDGFDKLVGGSAPDQCYVDADGGSRKSCENKDDGTKKRTQSTTARTIEGDTGDVGTVRRAGSGSATWWYVGNDDYLIRFDRTASQFVSYDGVGRDSAKWENNVCFYVNQTPAKEACDGAKLNTIWKVFFREHYSFQAALRNSCLDMVFDLGRHSSYGFLKKWKARPADDYFTHVANFYTEPGKTDSIETSDPDEVNGLEYIDVTCP